MQYTAGPDRNNFGHKFNFDQKRSQMYQNSDQNCFQSSFLIFESLIWVLWATKSLSQTVNWTGKMHELNQKSSPNCQKNSIIEKKYMRMRMYALNTSAQTIENLPTRRNQSTNH